ncbi:MAG: hypothetical protein M3422_10240 [Actinomycetota bacterium]|nr:hypothetical protein [Actinomycetota bacterium]
MSFSIELAGRSVVVELPDRPRSNTDGLELMTCNIDAKFDRKLREHTWGFRAIENLWYVNILRFEVRETSALSAADIRAEWNRLRDPLLAILDRVRMWLSAWTGQSIRARGSYDRPQVLIDQPDSSGVIHVDLRGTPILQGGVTGASRSEVEAAFRYANEGNELPVEHQLIAYAIDANGDASYRRAIIDAASAAEVALAQALTKLLTSKGVPSELCAITIKNANGIAELAKMYQSASGVDLPVSPSRIMNEVASIRNSAAHSGYIPTSEETSRAIGHARKLLADLSPLPRP